MLTIDRACVESRAMTGYAPGIRARQSILRELARREAAGLQSPSIMLLGEILDLHWSTARAHVNTLIQAGMIQRAGRRLTLTDCGRGAVETLMES